MRIRKQQDNMVADDVLLMANVSDALAHPVRVNLLRYIMSQNSKNIKVCNKDIVQAFDYAQTTISQHLKVMSKSGLIQIEKIRRFSYYYVNIGLLMKYINIVKTFE